MNQTYRFIERKTMQSIRRHGHRPLTHAVLAALCFTLTACIEDVIVSPDDPPDVDGGIPTFPVQPPDNPQSVYYDPLTFASAIQPGMDLANCSAVGCHHSDSYYGGFILFPAPAFGSYEMWSNLQFVTHGVDLAVSPFVAENNSFYQWATNYHAGTAIFDPEALRDWLEDAAARYPRAGGSFDADVFERLIQPILDSRGCTAAACHSHESGLPLPLFPRPAPGSVEAATNLQAVILLIELDAPRPDMTVFFERVVDRHGDAELSEVEHLLLLDWIQAAMDTVVE
jgi:hypothetical protein